MRKRDARVGLKLATVLFVLGGVGQFLARAAPPESDTAHPAPLLADARPSLDEDEVKDKQRSSLSPTIQRALAWLPLDTETLAVSQPFPMPSLNADEGAEQKSKPTAPDFERLSYLSAMEGLFELDKGKYLEMLAGKKVVMALRGARNFDVVSSFGSLRSEGCTIVVYKDNLDGLAKGWLNMLRDGAKEVRKMVDRDVFVFPSTIVMEPWVKPKPWQGTFIVALQPDTLLCASSDRYLEDVLHRLDTKPIGRALADDLPEWRHLDSTSRSWLLRHIPDHGDRGILQGLTFSENKNGFRVVYVPVTNSGESFLNQVRARWSFKGIDRPPDIRLQKDGTVVVSSADINPAFIWQLYHLPGADGQFGAE